MVSDIFLDLTLVFLHFTETVWHPSQKTLMIWQFVTASSVKPKHTAKLEEDTGGPNLCTIILCDCPPRIPLTTKIQMKDVSAIIFKILKIFNYLSTPKFSFSFKAISKNQTFCISISSFFNFLWF
jgi:hypothetical protein